MNKIKLLNKIKLFNKGFTLLELLVVVVIIGLLASIALPKYKKAIWKSKTSTLIQYAKQMGEAQNRYLLNYGTYTDDFNNLDIDIQAKSLISSCGAYTTGWDTLGKGFCANDEICICLNRHGGGTRYGELVYFTKGPYSRSGIFYNHNMIGLKSNKLYCRGSLYNNVMNNELCELLGLQTTDSDYWGKPYYRLD